jgi:hypothetical protein
MSKEKANKIRRVNYLSPALFAEHRGLTEEEGKVLIELARKAFNENHPDA